MNYYTDDLSKPLDELEEYFKTNRQANRVSDHYYKSKYNNIRVEPIKQFDPNTDQKIGDNALIQKEDDSHLVIEQRIGRRMRCDSCNHTWTYFPKSNGKSSEYRYYTSCPSCHANVKIRYTRNVANARKITI